MVSDWWLMGREKEELVAHTCPNDCISQANVKVLGRYPVPRTCNVTAGYFHT